MESTAQLAATLLMGLFALGVLGCAITIPICAVRFFAILFERSEEQTQIAGYRLVPVYESVEPSAPPESPAPGAQPSKPRARGAAAGK